MFSTLDPSEAIECIEFENIGLRFALLLVYRVRFGSVSRQFRNCCPHGRIVSVSNKQVDESVLYADAVVYGIEGAEALIDNVRTKLGRG